MLDGRWVEARLQRFEELGARDRGRADLADHDPGGRVGQADRVRVAEPGRQPEAQDRGHGVARARDVEDLACARADPERFGAALEEHHAVLAAGDQQLFDGHMFQQPAPGGMESGLISDLYAGGEGGFFFVGSDQG